MKPGFRQFGMAIAVSIVSLGLVVGGLSLALSENFTPPPLATETFSQPTAPILLTATLLPQILPSITVAPTGTETALPPAACLPPNGWTGITVGPLDTLEAVAARYQTTAQALVAGNCLLTQTLVTGSILYVPPVATNYTAIPTYTAIPCGAPLGWIRYVVQPGDTLYHIATSFGTTTARLQQANCMGLSTTIRVGQLLWVPNVPTRTPGVTQFPTFNPTTEVPTQAPTDTTVPPTPTLEPSDTPVPSATLTPITPQP